MNMNKKRLGYLVIAVGFILLVIGLVSAVTRPAGAISLDYYKTICHHTPANEVTLNFANEQSYNGHLGTPHNDQTFDTNGACVTVTPTVSPEPTDEVTPTQEPEVTPTVTPTTTPENVSQTNQTVDDGLGCAHHDCSTHPVVPAAAPNTGYPSCDAPRTCGMK